MNWKRYDWPSDILLPATFALLRVCWLWPWLEVLRRWLIPSAQEPLLAFPLMVALVLGGIAAARAARGNLVRARLAVTILGLFAAFLILWWRYCRGQFPVWDVRWVYSLAVGLTHWGDELPAPLVTLLAAAFLWWRGLMDGREPINSDHVWSAFGSGLLGLAGGLVVTLLGENAMPPSSVPLVLTHFGAGMISLAVCSLQLATGATLTPGEATVNTDRYWLATVAIVVCTILAAGVLLSLVIAPETVMRALAWGSYLLSLLGRVLLIVVYAISYVIFFVLSPLIQWLQSRFHAQPLQQEVQGPNFQQQLEELQKGAPPTADPAVTEALRWVGLAGLLVAIALAFALALLRYRRSNGREADETRESVFSRDLLTSQLDDIWRSWRQRFRRPAGPPAPYLSLDGEAPTRRAIREAYQRLLAGAEALGWPRPPSHTPAQYGEALGSDLPSAGDALDQLTEAYEEARYAPEPPAEARATRAGIAWQRIEAALADEEACSRGNQPAAPAGVRKP